MGSRRYDPVKTVGLQRVRVGGSFTPNGSSGISDTIGRGYSVARTSVGLYTVTFEDKYVELDEVEVSLRGADGTGLIAVAGDYSAANKTLQIRVLDTRSAASYPLDLTSARVIATNDIQALTAHGGILASDSTPNLARVNGATDKALRLTWTAEEDEHEVQFPPFPMLPGMSGANDISIHLLAAMEADNDTPTIDVQVFDAVGDTEMGGATAAVTDTLAELSVTIDSGDLSGHPLGFLNISLIPAAHTTDDLYVYAAWLETTPLVDLAADADNVVNFSAIFRNTSVDF